jgi:UDP:flavonoid glycosyltransferase YjiC (YdhE family)
LARAGHALGEGLLSLALRQLRRRANRVRQEHGLAPIRGPVLKLARDLPLYMVASCAELDYQRGDLPEAVHYVGECAWYPAAATPDWLLKRSQARLCVHVTEGTMHVTEPFLLRAARAGLADGPFDVVMTTGSHRSAESLGLTPLPSNFRVEPWVNHDALMPKMSAVICTGNSGTILAALRNAVPVVVVATEWDHAENAARVVHAGVGIRLSRRRCSPAALMRAVQEVVGTPSYRARAREVSATLAGPSGGDVAAGLLEKMVLGDAALH